MRTFTHTETYDFWFNNKEFDEHDQFGSGYYVNDFYKNIVFNLDIPEEGYIVVAGTHKAVSFDIPIAFAHNDVGSLSHTPEVKIHAHKWLTSNIVEGGYMMGNNNLNRAKFKFEEYMTESGFKNTQFQDLDNNKFNLSSFPHERIEGYMLSVKE